MNVHSTFFVLLCGSAAAAAPRLTVRGCPDLAADELARLVAVEMPGAGGALAVTCRGGRARLRYRGVARDLDLAAAAPRARARLVAIAAAELGTERRARRETESTMFDRVLKSSLAATLIAVPAAAAPAPPVALPPPVAARPSPRKPPPPSGPSVGEDDLVAAKQAAVNDGQIALMKKLLDNTAYGDPDRADLLFRMADLLAEKRRYLEFRARSLDQPIYEAKQKKDARAVERLTWEQSDFQARGEKALLESVKYFIEVAEHPKDYEGYKRMDEVLFSLAHLLGEAKRDDKALIFYKRLIKEHPESKYVADAYLAFAEQFFEAKDFDHALQFYEKVLQFPDSHLFAYARYKEGWVYINLGDHKRALGIFVDVIDLARKNRGAGDARGRIALEREARRDAVRAYARVGAPDKAWAFFQRIGGDAAPTMMEQLGELWNGDGRFLDAVQVYHRLMAQAPSSPRLCAWQLEVARNVVSATGSKADPSAATELERLAAVADQAQKSGALKPQDLAECRDNTAHTLREMAMTWHREAQKTNQSPAYQLADRMYKAYLERFKEDAYAITYYRGEALYQQERHCDAARVYGEVVKMDQSAGAKYLRDAALAEVQSWRSCLKVDEQKRAVVADASLPPQPIPEPSRRMIEAFERYTRYVKDSPELLRIKYLWALTLYDYNHFAEAIPLFRTVARAKDPELSVFAANLQFDCHAALKQSAELSAAVDEYAAIPELTANDALKARIRVIGASLLRETAERDERARRFREAGETYLRLAAQYPDYPQLDEVYYDACLDFQQAKSIGRAIQSCQLLLEKRPDSKWASKAIFTVGRAYQNIAAYESAAEQYEKFAERWPSDPQSPTALATAVFFRRGLGQGDKAVDDTERFVRLFAPRPELSDRVAGAAFDEGRIFEAERDRAQLEKHWRDYLKKWDGRGGVDREIVAHVRLGELAWRNACPIAGTLGACVEIHAAPSTPAIARARGRRKHAAICGTPGPTVTVRERTPAAAREAQEHFARALALWQNGAARAKIKGGDDAERAARDFELTYAVAEARMAQADADYEKFLKLAIPTQMDFVKDKAKSTKRFQKWIDGKLAAMESTRKVYESVILLQQPHWAIAAAARIGEMFQDFAAQLNNAPVPTPPPPPPGMKADEWRDTFTNAYCQQFETYIIAFEDKAIDALDRCLSTSTRLSWFNEWSQSCEAQLNQIRPREYPLATEIRAQPGYVGLRAERMPALTQVLH